MSLIAELRQRKVFRVAAAYAVVAWLLVQVVATVGPALKLPDWTLTFTTVLLALGFPLALMLAWTFDVVRDRGTAGPTVPGVARSVVVLPFVNLSDDPALGHFADGLVEDIVTRLQAFPGLKVASRQSAYAYKGRSVDVRTIARELACRHVVEGSVRRIDDRVRVTVQLIDAVQDEHLWAERYDHKLTDVFELQDQIRDSVVAAIGSRLAGTQAPMDATAAVAESASSRQDGEAERTHAPRRSFARPGMWWAVPSLVAAVALAALLTWTVQKRERERWAREEALPAITALIAEEKFAAALELVQQAAQVIPNDPQLHELEQQCSAPANLDTEPSGAKVYYRPYDGSEDDWKLIGQTPLHGVAMPIGVGLWRLEHPQRSETLRAIGHPGAELGSYRDPIALEFFKQIPTTIPLADAAAIPPGMVLVPATHLPIIQLGASDPVDLPTFYIDRLEVTNREYREFVAAGGYSEAAYWQDLPFGDGVTGWQDAVARFVDATGRPGPSTWQLGTYPDGQAEHPVGGLSWFEAMAYARFRGKELPTASHWYRAARSLNMHVDRVAAAVVRRGNFGGLSTQPVGRAGAIGPYGTDDMAGNVREWLWTAVGNDRMVAGGAWNEPPYLYQDRNTASPWDRSPSNGLRCIRTVTGAPVAAALRTPIEPPSVFDFGSLRPIDDAGYAVLESQLQYTPSKSEPSVTRQDSTNSAWTRERVTLPTGYDGASFNVQLFLPTGRKPPYQVVLFFPHSTYLQIKQPVDEFDPAATSSPMDFLVKSGRAFAVIAFDGMFERVWSQDELQKLTSLERYRLRLRHYRQDLGRTLDYLATREDIDATRIGVLAMSFGAAQMVPLLAVEPRVDAAVLFAGGVVRLGDPPPPDAPFNYLPRIRQPVLMLSGRWDLLFSQDSQERMLQLLGTPDDRKQRVVFDTGHAVLPQAEFVRLTVGWFDRYLGPVS